MDRLTKNVYFCNVNVICIAIQNKNKHLIIRIDTTGKGWLQEMKKMMVYAFADEASADIDRQIVAMKQNQLQGIEIRNVDGINISDISCEKAREVMKKMKSAGLSVWSIGSPIGKIGIEENFETHIEKFKHTMEIAQILECKNIRIFSFFMPQGKEPALYQDEVIRRLKALVELAQSSDIELCHENEKGIYGDTAKRCLEIHRAIPELKGVFDPANFIQCGQNTESAWELLQPYIKYLHIKDALADGTVVPAGAGIGNLKFIIDSFRAQGGVHVTVEPHLTVFEGFDKLEQSGKKTNLESFQYPSAEVAFQVACDALKKIIGEE